MKKVFIISMLLFVFIFSAVAVQAQTVESDMTPSATKLNNPLGAGVTPNQLIGRIINAILGVVGSLALLMFVVGGLTWMTSSGNPEKVKKGRDVIVWAAIGLVVVFASYGLVRFLLLNVKG